MNVKTVYLYYYYYYLLLLLLLLSSSSSSLLVLNQRSQPTLIITAPSCSVSPGSQPSSLRVIVVSRSTSRTYPGQCKATDRRCFTLRSPSPLYCPLIILTLHTPQAWCVPLTVSLCQTVEVSQYRSVCGTWHSWHRQYRSVAHGTAGRHHSQSAAAHISLISISTATFSGSWRRSSR
jgi:hypothetical protein